MSAEGDVVGYRKHPGWTAHAAFKAAAAMKVLFSLPGFWAWLKDLDRLRTRRALVGGGGRAVQIVAEALDLIEDLAPRQVDAPDQPAKVLVLDPRALREASEIVSRGLMDGVIAFQHVAERLQPITEVCSGCAFGARRAKILLPVMESVALHSQLQTEEQLKILVNSVRLAIVEGDYARAQQFLSRAGSALVRQFLHALPPERLKQFLQAGLELYGVDSDDGRLFWALLLDQGLRRGTGEAAGAARCLACKAVGNRHPWAQDWIEIARRHAAELTDEILRRDTHRAVEVIALYHELIQKTNGEWEALRGDAVAKRQLDAVRQLPSGRWPLRHAEAALLAALAFVASGDAKEVRAAKDHLVALKHRRKVTHCLFDLPALNALVDSFPI